MCKCRNCGNVAQFSRWYIKIHSGWGKSIWHGIMADGSRTFYSNKNEENSMSLFLWICGVFVSLFDFICIYFVYIYVLCIFCIIYILLIYIVYIVLSKDERIQIIVFTVSWAIMLSHKNTFASEIFGIDSRFDRNNCFSRYWYLSFIFIE